jgi:hypothetical protein
MLKICAFLTFMATTAIVPAVSWAQAHDHGSAPAQSAPATNPGNSWRQIEENLRNLTDAIRLGDMTSVSSYVHAMSRATDDLVAANIHNEVKPQEEDHLVASLENLKEAVDGLVQANETGDKAAIEQAVSHVAGAITLTRIDVPPGLLERISGAAVRAEIVNTPMLTKGQESTVTLRLKSAVSGKPLTPAELMEVHTEKVHALIIDPQLKDYTHAHPVAIDVPGEYTFAFTPQTDCTYRLWADVTPVKGTQEYAVVDIPGKEGCGTLAIDKTEIATATADGFTVNLKLPEAALTIGKAEELSFEITNAAGEAVTGLEPLMGAYAHVVGFYDDNRTIAHMHPMGAEPKASDDRGQSPIKVHFKPERDGFVKLYMQIQLEGKIHVFPFGVTVQ